MNSSGYGAPPAPAMSGGGIQSQRLPTQQSNYEAPACVQNAMMTKDKKPFTYTPGGIDLSQIKSERMAKRLARNAQAEGATGASQLNRPTQPHSPGGANMPPAASMGAAAMGMPFQVFPTGPPVAPPPPPSSSATQGGKQAYPNGAAPPPPPPPSTTAQSTLAPPTNGRSAPGSPSAARKSPTPQRFEPPPMGFRPEIKIPSNPMAALKKVPPPVEKNNFWMEEYRKENSRSPIPTAGDNCNNNNNNNNNNDSTASSSPISNNNDDNKKSFTPTTTTTNNYNNSTNQPQPSPSQYQQYSPQPPKTYSPPAQQSYSPPPQQQQSPRSEFRSVAPPQSPSVNVYTQQQPDRIDGPDNAPNSAPSSSPQQQQQRATDSPFRFAQQQQLQQRPQQTISPLAQQHTPSTANSLTTSTPSPATSAPSSASPAQAVPWRTQRQQPQEQQQQQQQQQPQQQHPQPIFNNVRPRDVYSPAPDATSAYQGPKPTNVGSLYIAPLAPPTEPQAQNLVRQQMQQQAAAAAAAAQRDSPMRQLPQQQQPQQQQQQPQQQQQRRWMTTQPAPKEQAAWARPEENGNVMPSSLQRMKSPAPSTTAAAAASSPMQQQQTQFYQPSLGNGFAAAPASNAQNFGSIGAAPTGLRLQITTGAINNQSGQKERIIPIQLEQTPTSTPSQPVFVQQQGYNHNQPSAAPSTYVTRSPNQFVDQGYNNYGTQQQQQQQQQQYSTPSVQRVVSPTQQLNAPRIIQQQQQQQQQQNNVGGTKTRIIPIAMEGQGGPISQTPIVIQNDQRTPPVQSKSFRILQKITDTIDGDDGTSAGSEAKTAPVIDSFVDTEPQLQRPQFARQMSAQQSRNSPTIEQMRRMQVAQDQQQAWNQGNTAATRIQQQQPHKYIQQRSVINNEDISQPYVHPSEQQVPEPKKYTGSAIPSRSFKILQAMTTPENAGPGQSDL